MLISTVLLFTQQGNEINFAFWTMTNFVLFVFESIYKIFRKLAKKVLKIEKKKKIDKPQIEIKPLLGIKSTMMKQKTLVKMMTFKM